MSQVKDGLILNIGVRMVLVFKRMRVYNHYPILYVRVGKAIYSTPISGKEEKKQKARNVTFQRTHYLYIELAKLAHCI